jgi:WhiB family transcriptional regulator, redox-sensing transcriptional regulator
VNNWQELAKCRGADVEIFFEPSTFDIAKMICKDCPVTMQCLRYGIAQDADSWGGLNGVWGGLTPDERIRLRRTKAWKNNVAS